MTYALLKLFFIVILIFYMIEVMVLQSMPKWFLTFGFVVGLVGVYQTQKEEK